jgi:hypothetical protein
MDLQRGVDHDASNPVELPIGFRQFGVFGALAVHSSGIGLPRRWLPPTMAVVLTPGSPSAPVPGQHARPSGLLCVFRGKSEGEYRHARPLVREESRKIRRARYYVDAWPATCPPTAR